MIRIRFHIAFLSFLVILIAAIPSSAFAGFWETSVGFNYSRSEYSGGSFAWTRRTGVSLGYNFNDSSTMEVAYQKSFERNHYEGFEDSFYDDKVYSVNWVQNILGKQSFIQPYFKLGVGQLIRNASIYDGVGRSQITKLKQVTGVIGAGMRLYLTKEFAIRIEGTSYLPKGHLEEWRDNFAFSFGVSLYF